jgi:branched-chain amino acid transport system permease protein
VRQELIERRLPWLILTVGVYLVISVTSALGILNDYHMINIITIGISIILGVSLNLINGFTGQFSLGHAGFMAVGAYTGAILTMKFGFPFPATLLCGGLAAAVVGLVIGLPTLRLRGDYLAIATLGFGEILRVLFINWSYVGGAGGMVVTQRYTNFHWVYAMTVLTIIVIRNWLQSAHGRACVAIREDEIAASSMGINTTLYKVAAFILGSFFAGVAGVLYAHAYYIVTPASFGFLKSVEILIIVVLGGMGSISGSVLAAIAITLVSVIFTPWPYLRMILYSLALIIVMVYRPGGLMGVKEIQLPALSLKKKEGQQVGTP